MIAARRNSKYHQPIVKYIKQCGHATNAQIIDHLRIEYPLVSATTVHRVTQRLIDDGIVQYAPHAVDGAMVFDANIKAHDHFECSICGNLRDITLSASCRDVIRISVGDCRLDGSVKIVGTCCDCIKSNKKEAYNGNKEHHNKR